MAIAVDAAQDEAQRRAVYRFRYQVYVEELGLAPPGTDRAAGQIRDALDEASTSYLLRRDQAVVGSLRVLRLADLRDPAPLVEKFALQPALEAFAPHEIATTSRFMLHPALRHGKAILALMRRAFEDARAGGVRLNYGDCSPHMLPLYEHLGYRRYGAAFNDPDFGYKLPIVMLLGDLEGFAEVRSPLTRVAERFPADPAARSWFERHYRAYLRPASASLLPDGLFLDLLAERVGEDPVHRLALLRGLSDEQATRFLAEAVVVEARPGDRVIRQGDRDDTLYVMLDGLAEVCLAGREDRPINTVAGGDTFGEIGLVAGLPRSASVIARASCQMLVLSADFLQRLKRNEPAIAAQVATNLARGLAVRLAMLTAQQGEARP
jgi:CRP-like cAMP-binding protein/N-acyl-L-homoserine lactone synthetase